jgi:hypothetical protein
MNSGETQEPFISTDLRPRVVPQLDTAPQVEPDCSTDDVCEQALAILGISERAWEALHPGHSRRDLWACRFVQSPELTWNTLDGETVILHTETSRYYTLNGSGSMIWEYYRADRTLADVLDALCEDFEVPREVASHDLLAFTGRLLTEDLLREIV